MGEEPYQNADGRTAQDAQDDGHVGLSDAFIREIADLLEHDYTDRIHELCRDLSPPDAADLIAKTGGEERHRLVEILGDDLDPETFPHLDPATLDDLLEHMPGPQVAAIVNELESDDAINLLSGLDEEKRDGIMRSLSRKVRAEVEEGLTFPEKSAGRLMQREFVAVPQFWTVGKTVDYLRAAAHALPDSFYDLYIVDPTHRFVGAISLSDVLRAQREVRVEALVQKERVTVPVDQPQERVAELFRRKDLLSAPVVDDEGRLIGIVTIDDVVDVIDAEAEDDFLKLGGVADSDIFSGTFPTVRARFGWLAINLLTAFLATWVISHFEGTISRIVALAALMPIVASMGGNAGTQTLTVAVRGLATREITAANSWRMVGKEALVGAINGALFGVLMAGVIIFWYGDVKLALVMGAAIVCNLLAAGLSGALIPLWLHRMKFDPAPSSAVFLTTVTDVVGFFGFLGLATWFLL